MAKFKVVWPRKNEDEINEGKNRDNVKTNSKISTESEKLLSTKTGYIVSPASPAVYKPAGDFYGGTPFVVDVENLSSRRNNSNSSRSDETNKKPIETVVLNASRHKVAIDVFDEGVEEVVKFDRIIRRRKIRFVVSYSNKAFECDANDYVACNEVIEEIAEATNYNVSKERLAEALKELRTRHLREEVIPIIDYVKAKYPERLKEIERDPFKWVLERTKEIVGYERAKLLTFLALVSTRLERVLGISRIHVLLVGPSGAGKSSTVKSVLKFLPDDDAVVQATRLTTNALGYLNIDSFDGRVLFVEQLDGQTMNYLRELMSEERICTVVTERDPETEKLVSRRVCINGQPVVITTSVVDYIDVNREQILNRFIKAYVKPENDVEVWKAILNRTGITKAGDVDALVFRAWLLSRPTRAELSDEVKGRIIDFMSKLKEFTREPLNRTVEIVRNLVLAVAIARGKAKADVDDFDFVMRNFMLDILYNGLGLSERDVEFIEALPDDDGIKSQEVADKLKVSKQYAINVLKNLERKGIVESDKPDGRTFTWWLSPLGKQIKALLSGINADVVETEEGVADAFFRPNDSAGRDKVPGVDGGGVSGNEGEVSEFMEYVKRNAGVTKEFVDIVNDFNGDKAKANRFVDYCLKRGLCRHKGIDAFEFPRDAS